MPRKIAARRSAIHGNGVFAVAPIAKGERIVEYKGRRRTHEEVDTDVTGDAAANKKLSQDRADAVDAAVKAAGANAKQLTGAEGYGSQFAKAGADAPDSEKEKDRRIALVKQRNNIK